MSRRKPKLTVIDSMPAEADAIEKLEQMLEAAEDGKLSMVAIATVYRDGSWGDTWSIAHNAATLIGAIECLKAKLVYAVQHPED